MATNYAFGPFRVDAEGELLFYGATPMALGRRAVVLLRVLLERPSVLVSKDQLIESAWSGLAVEESNLSVQIAALRRVLAAEPGAERWIETLARRGYRYVGPPVTKLVDARPLITPPLALPDKPSIAVLPFQNMSGDPEHEYFADGVVEDIVTALSRMRWLFVIARNSTNVYKGGAVDPKQVGQELGVRYILEGSVRKAGNRLRLAGQLIDGLTGANLWADRFEGEYANVFDLQDQMTASVVGALAPKLEQAEIDRARSKPTESLQAYDHYLRGLANVHRASRDATHDALQSFYRAIELDPDYASAHAMGAWCYAWRQANGWMLNRDNEVAEALRLAHLAIELGKDDAIALARGGIVLAYTGGELEDASASIARALQIDPNMAAAWHFSGWVRVYVGEPELAIAHQAVAMRLSPFDPLRGNMLAAAAYAHMFAGRYEAAISCARDAIREQPHFLAGLRVAAASNALAGRLDEAKLLAVRLRDADPGHRISNVRDRIPLRRPDDLAKLEDGLRLAGLPE